MRLNAFCLSEMFCVAQFCPYGRHRVISQHVYGAKRICADSNGSGVNTSPAHLDRVLLCEVRGAGIKPDPCPPAPTSPVLSHPPPTPLPKTFLVGLSGWEGTTPPQAPPPAVCAPPQFCSPKGSEFLAWGPDEAARWGRPRMGRTQPGELGVFLGLEPQDFREYKKQISTVLSTS